MSEAATENPVHDWIAKSVAEHPVILFMKGEPGTAALRLLGGHGCRSLDHLGVEFVGVDVLQSEPLREGIKTFSDWPTIPQLYVKGEFVGGCDIVKEMFQSGELKTLLTEQGLITE